MLNEATRVLITGGSGFIGTNLMRLFQARSIDTLNFDLQPPMLGEHRVRWQQGNIQHPSEIAAVFERYDPDVVVHLAAKTDTLSNLVEDYSVNYEGTRVLLDQVSSSPGVRRVVLVSTQFVLGPGIEFEHEEQFSPHTAYGESKARAERIVRRSALDVPWVILRPTNIWGPGHHRYAREFWRVLKRGLYAHPAGSDPIRCYGYVGSVCLQLLTMLELPAERTDRRTLYVGDPPIRLSEWVDGFSIALRGVPARRLPNPLLRFMATVGTHLSRVGLSPPITVSRYRSMTEDYLTPMEQTADALGALPRVAMEQGVGETTRWLDTGAFPEPRDWLNS